MTIAHGFSRGRTAPDGEAPEGRLNDFTRDVSTVPVGLVQCGTGVLALKRRAILQCPCGTGRKVSAVAVKSYGLLGSVRFVSVVQTFVFTRSLVTSMR